MATYEIILKNATDDAVSENKAVAGNNASEEPQQKKELSAGQVAVGKGLVAYKMASPWINKVVSHQISLVELKTGSKEAQQKIQFAYDIANQVAGIGTSILSGYAIGNIPGTVISAVVSVGGTALSYIQKAETLNLQKSLESRTLQINSIRAGASGSRRAYE